MNPGVVDEKSLATVAYCLLRVCLILYHIPAISSSGSGGI